MVTYTKGSYENQVTRDIGDVLRILQLNVKGISRSKSECLLKLANQDRTDVILLQETHCENEHQLNKRCKLLGYTWPQQPTMLSMVLHHMLRTTSTT